MNLQKGHRNDSGKDAEEVRHRWNAFEEGGIVSELVNACEALTKAFEGNATMDDMDAADFVDRARATFTAVEQAREILAKAKPE